MPELGSSGAASSAHRRFWALRCDNIHQLLVRHHTPAPRAALSMEAEGYQVTTCMTGGKQERECRGACPVQEGMLLGGSVGLGSSGKEEEGEHSKGQPGLIGTSSARG